MLIVAVVGYLHCFGGYAPAVVLLVIYISQRITAINNETAVDELQQLKDDVARLTFAKDDLYQKNRMLEEELNQMSAIINNLQSRVDRNDALQHQHTMRITNLESRSASSANQIHNGILLWKIDGYQRKRQDAINGVKTALYSQPFYSAQFGYKMCAKIYMNGDGFGKGSHLSLFFVVMRGDYDALQTWPFQKKITMKLLDQGNGDHMVEAFHSDPQSSSFQRPESDMNIPFGFPLFMPLDSLNTRQFIQDDVMFIKIIVE